MSRYRGYSPSGKPIVWCRHIGDGNHRVGIGRFSVDTKNLKPEDALAALVNLPIGVKSAQVREWAFRVADCCGNWKDEEPSKPKPKRKPKTYTKANRPSVKDVDEAARKTG